MKIDHILFSDTTVVLVIMFMKNVCTTAYTLLKLKLYLEKEKLGKQQCCFFFVHFLSVGGVKFTLRFVPTVGFLGVSCMNFFLI